MNFNINEYRGQLTEAQAYIQSKISRQPVAGIILGTGLGGLVSEMEVQVELDYREIPHFPESTVESHAGKLLFGLLGGKYIMVMQGRFHYYEGLPMQRIIFPIRLMHLLGIKTLLISNAGGGLNPQYRKGDLMLIDDQINLLGNNPLIGANMDEFGPRFPDMSEPYSKRLLALAEEIALENKLKVQKGCFTAVIGPNLETKAEYRFLRTAGADVVGMSTVPEVIAANHQGMEVLGVSVITDECFPDALQAVNVEEIIAVAGQSEPKLTLLLGEVVKRLES